MNLHKGLVVRNNSAALKVSKDLGFETESLLLGNDIGHVIKTLSIVGHYRHLTDVQLIFEEIK